MGLRDMVAAVHPRLFTVDEYYAMGEAGVFAPDERVELLDGEILTMPPMSPRHAGNVDRLAALFIRRLGSLAIVRIQGPVRLSSDSEPQPDIAILRPRDDFYSKHHPVPEDVFALAETADSSLSYDRGRKFKTYARCGIREYWIVNLLEERIEVHRRAIASGYAETTIAVRGDTVAFEAFDDQRFTVEGILGGAR
jgi:Uma2 family endonuclease